MSYLQVCVVVGLSVIVVIVLLILRQHGIARRLFDEKYSRANWIR
jgi:hypothetical protein